MHCNLVEMHKIKLIACRGGGGALEFEVGYHPCKIIHIIRVVVSPKLSSEIGYVITHSVHVVFCKLWLLYPHTKIIPMGLAHNDPWVESHMWPQQMWGQRSSGEWGSMTFGSSVWKKGHCILWCIFMGLVHNARDTMIPGFEIRRVLASNTLKSED